MFNVDLSVYCRCCCCFTNCVKAREQESKLIDPVMPRRLQMLFAYRAVAKSHIHIHIKQRKKGLNVAPSKCGELSLSLEFLSLMCVFTVVSVKSNIQRFLSNNCKLMDVAAFCCICGLRAFAKLPLCKYLRFTD